MSSIDFQPLGLGIAEDLSTTSKHLQMTEESNFNHVLL